MSNIRVVCRACGTVEENVKQNGELVEPGPIQKAQIIAEKHEEEGGNLCMVYLEAA